MTLNLNIQDQNPKVTRIPDMTTEQPKKWNPRYVEYARAHGKTVEEMLIFWERVRGGEEKRGDVDFYPLWCRQKIQDFCDEHWPGCKSLDEAGLADCTEVYFMTVKRPLKDIHAMFDAWLMESVTKDLAKGTT